MGHESGTGDGAFSLREAAESLAEEGKGSRS